MAVADTLINRYRPQKFSQVVGHDEIMSALQRAIEQDTPPHGFLFSGPAGTGKTTTARIIANTLKCEVLEIAAAVQSGVDDTRSLAEIGLHRSIHGAGRRMIVLDECHALTKKSWDVLLKILEEPPEHLFFALCTTDPSKVPDAIQTRCYKVPLKRIKTPDLEALIEYVCEEEGWKPNNDVFQLVLQAAEGSARRALSLMEAVHAAEDLHEAERILSIEAGNTTLLELCKEILQGHKRWEQIQSILKRIDMDDFEQGLVGVGRYMAQVMVNSDKPDVARRAWHILDALTAPCETFDRKAMFFAAIGRIVWG